MMMIQQAREVSMIDQLIGFVAGFYAAYFYLFCIRPIWINARKEAGKGGE